MKSWVATWNAGYEVSVSDLRIPGKGFTTRGVTARGFAPAVTVQDALSDTSVKMSEELRAALQQFSVMRKDFWRFWMVYKKAANWGDCINLWYLDVFNPGKIFFQTS